VGRFLKLAAIVAGLYFGWQRFSAPEELPDVASQSADIEIYTTTVCPYCKEAKAYMDARGIEYLEKDVEHDMDLRRELRARGGRGVPYLFVYGEPMRGFDAARFETLRAEGS
jgi:glutaredoxin